MEDFEVCLCKKVMKSTIIKVIKEKEFVTLADIQKRTNAGTVCGGCIPDIEEIIAEMNTDPNI